MATPSLQRQRAGRRRRRAGDRRPQRPPRPPTAPCCCPRRSSERCRLHLRRQARHRASTRRQSVLRMRVACHRQQPQGAPRQAILATALTRLTGVAQAKMSPRKMRWAQTAGRVLAPAADSRTLAAARTWTRTGSTLQGRIVPLVRHRHRFLPLLLRHRHHPPPPELRHLRRRRRHQHWTSRATSARMTTAASPSGRSLSFRSRSYYAAHSCGMRRQRG